MIITGKQTLNTFAQNGKELHYLCFIPRTQRANDQSWPLLIFLHGLGERGNSQRTLSLLTIYGPCMMVEKDPDFPCVVVSPQCPSESWWTDELDLIDGLLDELLNTLHVDPGRVYFTGLSMGGFGTWQYGLQHPERCAALVPIVGGYIRDSSEVPTNLCVLKDTPIWAFHGSDDKVVEPYQTEILVNALRDCGSSIRYTCLEGADHKQSWERAYADPEMWSWLFAQNRCRFGPNDISEYQ